MTIKKGDKIKVLAGKDRGKTGRVLVVDEKSGKVMVEKINVFKKHQRPKREGQKGEIVNVERPFPASRVMVICLSCGKASRSGIRMEKEKKVRYCKKCNVSW